MKLKWKEKKKMQFVNDLICELSYFQIDEGSMVRMSIR